MKKGLESKVSISSMILIQKKMNEKVGKTKFEDLTNLVKEKVGQNEFNGLC